MTRTLQKKTSRRKFIPIQVWEETRDRLVKTAKKRKQTLASYVDELSKMFD